jgi:hypothetical protein
MSWAQLGLQGRFHVDLGQHAETLPGQSFPRSGHRIRERGAQHGR